MSTPFTLAVCSEMVFTDRPLVERIRAIDDLGFQVEIWDWTVKDIDALVATGATFSSMTGYVTGVDARRALAVALAGIDSMQRHAPVPVPTRPEVGA